MSSLSHPLALQARKQVVGFATVAVIGITYFTITIIALHFLRTDLNPIERPTSEYAVGSYGFLMTSAFLAVSLASFALVLGLYRGITLTPRTRIGLGLLTLWAIGVLIAMTFPIDPEGASRTTAGTIHRINGPLSFLSLVAGAILVSRRLELDEHWRPVKRHALILSLAMLILAILAPLNIALDTGLVGLVQRIFLVTFVAWFLLMATRLRALAHVEGQKVD